MRFRYAAGPAAARVVLREIDRLAKARADFAFESTLSWLTYVRRLETWPKAGYRVEINLSIDPWRTLGLSMKTRVNRQNYWSGSRENHDAKKKA